MMAHPPQHEEDLVRRVQHGDAAAFDRLVELYAPRIYAIAYRLLGNAEDAQDTVQEAFVRIYRALPRFKWESAFSTWMYRIATNVCYDELSRRRRRPTPVSEMQAEDDEPALEAVASDDESLEECWLRRERQRAIQQAITELPDQFRMVIVLCDIQGMSYQEIGTVLRVNVGTIKSRLNRARILLREKLSKQRELFGASDGPTQQVAPMAEKE